MKEEFLKAMEIACGLADRLDDRLAKLEAMKSGPIDWTAEMEKDLRRREAEVKEPTAPCVMVDLETLGNRPGSVIVAIGAVKFDPDGQEDQAMPEFYARVTAESCVEAGLTMDPGTVRWWMRQAHEARMEVADESLPRVDLVPALEDFAGWAFPNAGIWGNGADFDNALLAAAYQAVGMSVPWPHWKSRCYRTVKALAPKVKMERTGTHHNALDDARDQARHLLRIFNS